MKIGDKLNGTLLLDRPTLSMRVDHYCSIDKRTLNKIRSIIDNDNDVVNKMDGLVFNISFGLEHKYENRGIYSVYRG